QSNGTNRKNPSFSHIFSIEFLVHLFIRLFLGRFVIGDEEFFYYLMNQKVVLIGKHIIKKGLGTSYKVSQSFSIHLMILI
ncbi:MAG: hypothetical protein KAY43_05710, partial [Phocaeicola sp.]|nr:hypothetical protein [Phocaeicola sp.]